jgi:ATP-dependent helicase/nuclease subunit A
MDVLANVVNPSPPKKRDAGVAPGCPAFGGDSVRERPDNVTRRAEDSVIPGQHRPRAGEHHVVWWDPSALDLDKEHDVGLRQQKILAADVTGTVAEEGERLHAEWQEKRSQSIAAGSKPSLRVRTVTEAKNDPKLVATAAALSSVAFERTDASRTGRPHGKRFGVLVHAILAAVPLAGDQAEVEEVARAQARLVGAPAEEIAAAVSSVLSALRHPLLVRAHAAGAACRRESQASLRLEDDSMLEGVIDLAFREMVGGVARWTVVDFKTDVEIASRRPEYEGQVNMYARAVSVATGEDAVGVFLSV